MTTRTFNVSTQADLNSAITQIDADPAGSFTDFVIELPSNDITLGTLVPVITLDTSDTLVIKGDGHTINGSGQYRPFFINFGVVTIRDLTITNAVATGGAGGTGARGGGGGLGAGGAVFLNAGALTLSGVTFANDAAVGGQGGATGGSGLGGGGGLGGKGGSGAGPSGNSATGNGGGGGGFASDGTAPFNTDTGGVGGVDFKGVTAGGVAPPTRTRGVDGGIGGGAGGGAFVGAYSTLFGGTGGDFGGGGGLGGAGGFGGGGGGRKGSGGFGGGGGGYNAQGGPGGGNTGFYGSPNGGGGAGLGGAVFVRTGAVLTLGASSFNGDSVTAGYSANKSFIGSKPGASNGAAAGVDLFVMTGRATLLDPGAGRTLSLAGGVADDSASGLPGGSYTPGTASGAGLVVVSGSVSLGGTSTYAGGTTITNGAALIAASNAGLGAGPVSFGAGGGTLVIAPAVTVTNTITSFTQGDTIDLRAFPYVTGAFATFGGNQLTISSGGLLLTLNVSGMVGAGTYTVQPETAMGRGGSVVTTNVACYVAGTRILTDHGEVAIEDLRVGDRVVTLVRRGLAPVRWIGVRQLDLAALGRSAPFPIRITAGAFGPGMPTRDLLVSPDHAIFLDGRLIPACRLVDERRVRIAREASIVTYCHLEFDHHDVVVAEGLPAESWLDTGNRHMFGNAGALVALGPDFTPTQAAEFCAPRATERADMVNRNWHPAPRATLAPRHPRSGHAGETGRSARG